MKRSELKKIRGWAERIFTVWTLVFSTEAFLLLIPHSLRQLIWFGTYLVFLVLTIGRLQQVVRAATRGALLWLLIAMVPFSALWSDFPSDTLRQSIAVIGTTLIGVYLAGRYTLKEQLWLLAWTFGIIAVLSVVFALGLPAYGMRGDFWIGIYHQKNLLGRVMLLSAIVFLLMSSSLKKRRWIAWGGFGLSLLLLLLSGSKTALALCITLISLLPFYRAIRLHYKLAIPAVITQVLVGAGLFIFILVQAESLVGLVGKDLTFTGRTELWTYVTDMIKLRPWLGYGFGGFWQGFEGDSAYIWRVELWYPEHAHNGFLNLWLNLGFVGVAVFALSFFVALIRGARIMSLTRTPEYLLPMIYLTFLVLYNLSESVILLQNTLFWILYVTAICSRVNPDDTRAADGREPGFAHRPAQVQADLVQGSLVPISRPHSN